MLPTLVDKLFASTPVLSTLNIFVVRIMMMGLGIFCVDNKTAFVHAFLNLDESRIFAWRLKRGPHSERVAGPLRPTWRRVASDG